MIALKIPKSFSEDLRILSAPPSEATGVDAEAAHARLESMRQLLTGAANRISSVANILPTSSSIEGKLSEKRIGFKRLAASVGMHLSPDWRVRLFAKLDALMDPAEWDEDFAVPSEPSFSTFLRMIIYLHPTRRPGIGLSSKGHFLASWTKDDDRIVIECLANDEVRWVLSHNLHGYLETGAGTTKIYRIPDVIAAYEPDELFSDGHHLLI
jgi:hypothetical protein